MGPADQLLGDECDAAITAAISRAAGLSTSEGRWEYMDAMMTVGCWPLRPNGLTDVAWAPLAQARAALLARRDGLAMWEEWVMADKMSERGIGTQPPAELRRILALARHAYKSYTNRFLVVMHANHASTIEPLIEAACPPGIICGRPAIPPPSVLPTLDLAGLIPAMPTWTAGLQPISLNGQPMTGTMFSKQLLVSPDGAYDKGWFPFLFVEGLVTPATGRAAGDMVLTTAMRMGVAVYEQLYDRVKSHPSAPAMGDTPAGTVYGITVESSLVTVYAMRLRHELDNEYQSCPSVRVWTGDIDEPRDMLTFVSLLLAILDPTVASQRAWAVTNWIACLRDLDQHGLGNERPPRRRRASHGAPVGAALRNANGKRARA